MRMRGAYKPGPKYRWPFLLMIVAVAVLGFFAFRYFSQEAANPYLRDLQEYRARRQRFIDQDPQSPWLGKGSKPALKYFAPQLDWRVEAEFDSLPGDSFDIQKIRSVEKTYSLEGHVRFTVDDKAHRLLVYRSVESPDPGHVFLPFCDATSGQTTYEGGRYLDLKPEDLRSGRLLLDFNLAYQPFCAHDTSLVCPMPPAENTLPFELRAGERN